MSGNRKKTLSSNRSQVLNHDIRYAAVHLPGWFEATTVAEKQALAIEAQKIVEEAAEIGGKSNKSIISQHPNLTNQALTPIPIVKPVKLNTSSQSPMEINAIIGKNYKRNPFPAIRSICIQNNLCLNSYLPLIQRRIW